MTWDDLLKLLADPAMPVITFVVGGVCGFLVSRYTMSKAERKDHEQVQYQNGLDLRNEKEARVQAFQNAMVAYIKNEEAPSLDDFFLLSTTGNSYFNYLKNIADAIVQEKVDKHVRDNTFIPDIVEAINKTIPKYYTTLKAVAERISAPYDGRFLRSNYESLFVVAEKYAANSIMPPVASIQPRRGSPDD